ncbi:putative uncharacterized protein [Oscillibacter sp. CAG:155]|nr:putative uncharacterized protein [Oscillibacter sp. CAG:155]
MLLGPGHGHVAKPPLLLQLLLVVLGGGAGEDPLLHAHHVHVRELQALGGVDGHHGHAVIVRRHAVQVRVQRDLVEEAGEGGVLRLLLQETQDVGLEFLDVFDAAPALHVVFLLQGLDVAGLLAHRVVKLRQGQLRARPAQSVDEVRELQELAGGAFELWEHIRVAEDLIERGPLLLRQAGHFVHGGGADAPGGDVDNPAQPQIIQGVVQNAQIRQHVLDLRPVEELHAPYHFIRNAVALHGIFQGVGLGVHPVEHRRVPEVPAPVEPRQDAAHHVVGLVAFVVGGLDGDGVAAAVVGPEGLALTAGVVLDDGVGGVQDVLGGAVVLLQADGTGGGILLFKVQDVFDVGAPEAVDGLVVIAHHAEVLPPARQKACEQVLHVVGVLVLVHQHVAELVLVVRQHIPFLPQEGHGVVDDVVKVQRVGRPELFGVGGVDLGDAAHLPVVLVGVLGGKLLRALVLVLGVADDGEDAAGLEGLLVQVQLLEDVPDDPLGVVGVIDRKVLVEADAVDVPPEDTHAGRVERGGPDVLRRRAQPGRQTLLQLPRRLIGKGDGQDLPGPGHVHGAKAHRPPPGLLIQLLRQVFQKAEVLLRSPVRHLVAVAATAVGQKVVHPLDQHRGLAAAGPRQQQQRPLGGHGGLALHGVEPLEIPGNEGPPGGDVSFVEISHMFTSLPKVSLTILRQKPGRVNRKTPPDCVFSAAVLYWGKRRRIPSAIIYAQEVFSCTN